jgi:serine protease Do
LATEISVGQFVFAIGNTIAKYPNTITMWILWGKNKSLTINGNNLYIGLYQTDAQSNPGNSGGPLIDINGNTLWIVTAISEGEWISFALPISQEFIENTIASIETFGKITRPIMGIQYLEITPTIKKEKNLSIDAWLKAGDSILSVNWIPITRNIPFLYQLYTHIPWNTIELEVVREGKTTKIPVLLGWNTQ